MATESLIVEVDARTTKLEAALKKAGIALDGVDTKVTKVDSGLTKLTAVASSAASGVATVTKATLAAGAALATFIVLAAKSNQEMENMASTAKLTVEEFEPLAFAMSQFGVDAQGTADAMNDVTERIGEFAAAGSGAFQDYADVMKLDAEAAQELATEMQYLSGDAAIGLMIDKMEAAEVPAAQMSFVLKSMSNDLEYASGAFANNGAELSRLQTLYAQTAGKIKLTNAEATQLQEAATNFDLLTSSMYKSGQYISAQLAPIMSSFFGDIIEIIPEATAMLTDFINGFKIGEDMTSIESVNRLLQEQQAKVSELRQQLTSLAEADKSWTANSSAIAEVVERVNASIEEETARIDELVIARERLTEEEKTATAEKERLAAMAEKLANTETNQQAATGTGDQIKEIEDRFKTETALLTEKLNEELKLVGESEELKKQLKDQYAIDLEAIGQESYAELYDQELAALTESYTSKLELASADNDLQLELHAQFLEQKKALDLEYSDAVIQSGQEVADAAATNAAAQIKDSNTLKATEISNAASIASSVLTLASAAFEDNKAIQYAQTGINTATAIMNQYTSGDGLCAFARASAVAATGITQLAAIKSSSAGSTSVSSVSSTSSTTTTDDDDDEVSTINLDSSDASGSATSIQITFAEGMSDEFTQLLSSNLKVMDMNGTLLS